MQDFNAFIFLPITRNRYAADPATKNFHCGKIPIEVYSKKSYLGRVGKWNALPFKSAIFSLAGMNGKAK
jgi:hypothetical protein